MACFITPIIMGIIIATLSKIRADSDRLKLNMLVCMLLGGAIVLAIEHAWHGEIVPYPPFLTAMKNLEEMPILLHEMGVVGGSMTLATVFSWFGVVSAYHKLKAKSTKMPKIVTALK